MIQGGIISAKISQKDSTVHFGKLEFNKDLKMWTDECFSIESKFVKIDRDVSLSKVYLNKVSKKDGEDEMFDVEMRS